MEKVKLNVLPAPTFGWLNVNAVEREQQELPVREISINKSAEDPARIDIADDVAAEVTIYAAENAHITSIEYITAGNARLKTNVTAEQGAKVRLVQVYDNAGAVVGGVDAHIAENASFELVQLYLGGVDIVCEMTAELGGRKSGFTADIGYLLGGEDKLDINLLARHTGKKSESQINVKGVMSGSSHKTFKGTIDFVKGAAGAKGAEQEEVLLMDETVRNRTVPLILCAEEDVEGSHGASIGRIDENHVFYMQSRGIPTEKIYELMARSKIEQILKKIGDEQTVGRIRKSMNEVNEDE